MSSTKFSLVPGHSVVLGNYTVFFATLMAGYFHIRILLYFYNFYCYCKLFRLLMQHNIPASYLRLLLNLYTNSVVCASWNGIRSPQVPIQNGVRQGGIISPILFCVYIDSLLQRLRESGVGCYIGHVFTGALAYADDVVLIAPTSNAMRIMLDM